MKQEQYKGEGLVGKEETNINYICERRKVRFIL